MTLKEKFVNVLKQAKIHFIKFDAEDCEKIADNYAIEFAEWIEEYQGGTPNSKILKELLEIFKKEIRYGR